MTLTVDESAVKRIEELRAQKGNDALMLRVRVDGGGCSGFQYKLELTEEAQANEDTFADCVLSDDISLTFLEGAVVRFDNQLIGAEFKIDNPNAVAGCGCGTSFAV